MGSYKPDTAICVSQILVYASYLGLLCKPGVR
jgi:hypothetical protein